MTEEIVKPSILDVPFSPSPPPISDASSEGQLSSAPIIPAGPGAAKPPSVTMAVGRSMQGTSFTATGDADPYSLLYTNPAHAPPSLAQRAHGTETLFQYYTHRGYKELLMELNSADASKAVQACLDCKADSHVGAAALNAGGQGAEKPSSAKLGKRHLKNAQVIDRCLAEPPSGVPAPLRPPQEQDKNSLYLSQKADEERAQVKARRRAHLHQPPTESLYMGRYYPAGIDVLPTVSALGVSGSERRTSATGDASGTSNQYLSFPSLNHGFLTGNTARSVAPTSAAISGARPSESVKLDSSTIAGRTQTLAAPLRASGEDAVQAMQLREGRRLLAQQIDEVFMAAYFLRDPAAAKRRQELKSDAGMHRPSQAAAKLLADGVNKRKSTAAGRGSEKKRKSTARAAPAATEVEGGFPLNLSLFRSALLLLSNEDGAVTLDQLCAIAADVPFNVPNVSAVGRESSATLGNAMLRLFQILQGSSRALNAVDAADLLLAVASASAPGGLSGRQTGAVTESSVSCFPTSTTGGNGGGVAAGARASNSSSSTGNKMRGMGASVTTAVIFGGSSNRMQRSPIMSNTRGAGSPNNNTLHPPAASVSFASNTHSSKAHPTNNNGSWNDTNGPFNSSIKRQSAAASELKDSRRYILVLELLDALDALLNSAETKQIVRWECFSVLAAEGHGYIHKSQLKYQRRHACRDGSASEESAAVMASMVRSLEDAFNIVAAEEEAAYLKATRKGRKGRAAAVSLNSNQKSAIPLHLMRKSHMNFQLFCRFFDELPQMPAAFAHVWLPLLMSGTRWQPIPSVGEEEGSAVSGVRVGAREGSIALDADVVKSEGAEGVNDFDDLYGASIGGATETVKRALLKSVNAPGGSGGDTEGFPIELLGDTPLARQAFIQRLLAKRMEQLQEACEALEKEKEKLQEEAPTGSGAFVALESSIAP
ncbi:hypothetical protein ABL78_4907 [Leptomonas seymouri]|uniref:Uncharacterized protein n=1 Tax=Leptomonas seymouri TaxID=5684 RepID=A0A0N1HVX7_LEPSE|nr:hypothetical protein ABL78_4907 [Leptomonas seymouri]|eukprot:KPI86038.1 hypothetical protein ABL78_4907 [Leptomonas seymouri]